MSRYLIAKIPTPLLNTSDFMYVFGSQALPLDEKGLLRAVEMVALEGTIFTVKAQISPYIFEVETREYLHSPLFLDVRFTEPIDFPSLEKRRKQAPCKEEILRKLEKAQGLPYIWGGNYGAGILEISKWYQPTIPPSLQAIWMLQGVDCSGLLYEATDGFTPRNTSELMNFGKQLNLEEPIEALDIFVWPGHVVVALSSDLAIESRYGFGVITSNLKNRIMQFPSNFIVRRFI